MTDFILNSTEPAAERPIQERTLILLSARDSETFVHAILNAPEPGKVLRKAAKRYQKRFGK